MNDKHKTKAQLIAELEKLRRRVAELEKVGSNGRMRGAPRVGFKNTERVDEAFSESAARFRALSETAASPIFIFQDLVFRYANPATSKLTGYTREELLTASILDLVHPEFRKVIKERVLAWQRGESVPSRSEFKILTRSGETRWLDADTCFFEFDRKPAALTIAFDITDRKGVEEALRESEAKFRVVAETAASAIFIYQGSKFLYVNPATEAVTGYSSEELLNLSTWEIVHPEHRAFVKERGLARQRGEHVPQRYEFKIVTKGGETRWLGAAANLLEYEGKSAVLGTGFDVTERKLAEKALRESEARFRLLAETAESLINIYCATSFLYVNPYLVAYTGYSKEELLSMRFWEFVHPDYQQMVKERGLARLRGQSPPSRYEVKILTKSGEERWVDFSASPTTIQGEPAVLATGLDITEHKRAEEHIYFQASLLDQVRNAVIAIDLENRVVLWNSFAETLYQWTREEAFGRKITELILPDAGRTVGEAILDSLTQTGHWEGELVTRRRDGSTFPAYVHNATIKGASGEIVGYVGVSTDLSERKRLDRALWESEARFQSFMRYLPGSAWIKDIDGNYVFLNLRLQETLSNHQEDWRGRTDSELFPPEAAAQFLRNDRIVLTTRRELQVVETWMWKGEVRHALVTKFPIFDEQGELVLVAGASVDITDLRNAEDDVRSQKEILQKIFDHIPVMVAFIDSGGKIKLLNRAWEQVLGWTFEETQGLDIFAEMYPDGEYRQFVLDFVEKSTGEWCDFTTRVRDGSVLDTSWASVRLSDGTRIGIGQDITERKRADELVRRQTAQLAALHEIGIEISAERESSRVLEVATRRAAELLNAYHSSTYVRDPEQAHLNLVASLDSELIGLRLKEGEGLAGRVVLLGHAQAVDDYRDWEGRAWIFDTKTFGPALSAPLKWQQTVIGAISLVRRQGEEPFTAEDSHFLEQIAAEIAIAIHQATLFEEVQDGRERLQVLSHRLIDVQEAERQRLARELHDQIGQALTAVQISLHNLQSASEGSLAGPLAESLAVIDEALQQVHDLSLDLRPSLLDDLGLVAALRWYVDRVASRAGLVRCFSADALETRFAAEIETACFRIAQEAMTNVLRHALARTVSVQVKRTDSMLQLLVQDDGVGFDVRAAMSRTGLKASLGLHGMQERAAAVDGLVEIRSQLDRGTEVVASFPLKTTVPLNSRSN
jgi:PAS domain S-box-containing protein